MAELIADLFISLDGFAAGVGTGPFFGYGGPDLAGWVRAQLNEPHVVVMGRVTYQALAQISASATDETSTGMTALPKVVVSSTLAEPLSWANTRLLRGDPAAGIAALKEQSAVPLRSVGSLRLVASLVRAGLVDRLRLLVFPLVLGEAGREPAFAGFARGGLELAGTEVLDSRLVLLEYRPGAEPGPA